MGRKLELASDRRDEERWHLESKVDLRILDVPSAEMPEENRIKAVTTNVSRSGMRVAVLSCVEMVEGAVVKLKIRVNHQAEVLHGVGEWVWFETSAGSYAVGICVSHSHPRRLRRWKKFITTHFG